MNEEFDLISYNENHGFETLKIGILCWVGAFLCIFVPMFSIPFIIIAIYKSFIIKSNLMKVVSIIVACFSVILNIYYVINLFANFQNIMDELDSMSSLIKI